MDSKTHGAGWASRTLEDGMRQAEVGGLAAWLLLMGYAVVTSDTSVAKWLILLSHLVVFVLALVTLRRRIPAGPLLLAVYALMVLDYWATADPGSALGFVTLWTTILTAAVPILIFPFHRAWPFSLLAILAGAAAIVLWGGAGYRETLVIVVVKAFVASLAMLVLITRVRAFARDTDAQELEVASELQRSVVRRKVAQEAAEESRVMHDTIINTLSAIGAGGHSMRDVSLVRERCREDARAVEALLEGQLEGSQLIQLSALSLPAGMTLRRTGLGDDELERLSESLPAGAASGLTRAVFELVQNAVKHSDAQSVRLDAQHLEAALVVTVADDGKGFDGQAPPNGGLTRSVMARMQEVSGDVRIRSAPGSGTAVTLSVPLNEGESRSLPVSPSGADIDSVVGRMKRIAGWTWAIAMLAFDPASVVTYRPAGVGATLTMLVVVGGLTLITWMLCRGDRFIPSWMTGVLVVAIPAVFVLGLSTIDFGREGFNAWPLAATMALPVVLLVTHRSRMPYFAGLGLLALAATIVTIVVWLDGSWSAATIPAGTATALVVLFAWAVLVHVIDTVGGRYQRNQQELIRRQAIREAEEAAARARARWTHAGAQAALSLLTQIARSELDPRDPRVQRRCDIAGHYLRQVLLLNPEVVRMNSWAEKVLARARSRSVSVVFRGWTVDAPSDELAAALGRLILDGVDTVPPDTELHVGLFAGNTGVQLLLTGPAGAFTRVAARARQIDSAAFSYRQIGQRDLLEVTVG